MKKMIAIIILISLGISGCNRSSDIGQQKEGKEIMQNIPSSEEDIYAEPKEIAECYRNIYEQAVKDKTQGTLETVKKIVSCLGKAGYPAVDFDNQVDMVNSEQVEQFCRHVEEKEEAGLTIITVTYGGGFVQYDLQTSEGKVNIMRSSLSWKGEEPEVMDREGYSAHNWVYSPKGYLFFQQYYPPGFDGPSGYSSIRIKPLDEKCRELNRKYLVPIGYNLNNMFTTDWSENDYGDLNFYDLYEIMYKMKFSQPTSYKFTDTEKSYDISKEEFEGVFQTYFQINSEKLQKRTTYHKESNTYQYRPRGMYDFAPTPYIPYPEVVSYEENEDETITLIVNAVWPEESTEQAFSHELVVRPLLDGGVQYVSNHVIPSEHNVEQTWYTERLTDEEWVEYTN